MKRRETFIFCLILAALLAVIYLPQMLRPGGITFGVIQDITNVYGFYPWDMFTTRELHAGYFPLWNPHNALGEPHLANMQSAVFYPLTWIKVIADMRLMVLDLLLVLRLFLAGLFAYWFLGDLKLNFWGRVFGAASFATTGYFTRYVYMSHLNVEILIPLILFCFGRLARDGGRRWFILSALAVWLSVVGGFPEATLYALLLGVMWFFYCHEWKVRPPQILTIVGAMSLGGLLSLPQFLPFIEYLADAWTYHVPDIGTVHLKIQYAISLIVPWFFGTNDVSPLVPFLAPYVGMATATFAMVGVMRKERNGWFYLAAAAFLFGLIYGVPPVIWLGKIYPFSLTINSKYAVPAFAFCVSVLAGMGFDEIMEKRQARKVLLAVGIIAALILLALVASWFDLYEPFRRMGSLRWIWYYAVILAVILMLPISIEKGRHVIPLTIIFLFFIYPAGGNRPKYDAAVEEAARLKELNLIRPLKRFAAEGDILFPDLNLLGGLNDIRYYNPMYLKNYVEVFARANGLESEDEIIRNFADHAILQPLRHRLNDPLWAKMGLEYWVGYGPPGSEDLLPRLAADADWRADKRHMVGRGKFQVGDDTRPVLLSHSPAKVELEVEVPADEPRLTVAPAIDPRAWGKTDGVVFEIRVKFQERESVVYFRHINPGIMKADRTWNHADIDLSGWAGQHVNLIFITNPGPHSDMTSDWAGWGAPAMAQRDSGKWRKINAMVYLRPAVMARVEGNCSRITPDIGIISSQSYTVSSSECPGGNHAFGVITAHAHYPGWKAYSAGGRQLKIETADGVFQTVKALNVVKFVYHPASFAIGLWAFITSICFMLTMAVLRQWTVDSGQWTVDN